MTYDQFQALKEYIDARIREALARERPGHNRMTKLDEWETSEYKEQRLLETLGEPQE